MNYEDNDILWLEEEQSIGHPKQLYAFNLVIRINDSTETFNVLKSRFGERLLQGIPLNFLDDYLEHPDWNWSGFERKLNELRLVKK